MSIKVTLGEAKTQGEKPFPKLMSDKHGNIVLATGRINNEGGYEVVYINGFIVPEIGSVTNHFSLFDEANPFTDYNEPITLQND